MFRNVWSDADRKKATELLRVIDGAFTGDDWKGSIIWKRYEGQLAGTGVSFVYLPYTKGVSTTGIRRECWERKAI